MNLNPDNPESDAGSPHAAGQSWRDRAAPVFVWTVWAVMLATAILFVRKHSANVPCLDDFETVEVVTGHAPLSLQWLWSQHNEHRVALSRLILVGLFRLTHDFRAGMYGNVALLASAAAGLILLARRLRGRTWFTDAVFPIALLQLGQAEVLLLGFAMNLLLPAWIAYALLGTAATLNGPPGPGGLLRFGLCLAALPLCGGNGLVMVPPLALWLCGWTIHAGWSAAAAERERGAGTRQWVFGFVPLAATAALVALYLHGYQRPSSHPVAPSPGAVLVTMREFLSNVICPAEMRFWQLSSAAVVFLAALTGLRLACAGWRSPDERPRATALLLSIVAAFSVALAVGVGRSGFGPGVGFGSRYIPIGTPLLAVLYITWVAYGPRRLGRIVQLLLFLGPCLSLPSSRSIGLQIGAERRAVVKRVEQGLRDREPGERLVAAAGTRLYPDRGVVYDRFVLLKAARIGRFGGFRDERTAARDGGTTARPPALQR